MDSSNTLNQFKQRLPNTVNLLAVSKGHPASSIRFFAANGQVVDKDGMFVVGGSQLRYPGDPSGAPKQVINCRCTFVVNVPEPNFGGQ